MTFSMLGSLKPGEFVPVAVGGTGEDIVAERASIVDLCRERNSCLGLLPTLRGKLTKEDCANAARRAPQKNGPFRGIGPLLDATPRTSATVTFVRSPNLVFCCNINMWSMELDWIFGRGLLVESDLNCDGDGLRD
jgi:hypothetical protein